jgi:hypothetical protein
LLAFSHLKYPTTAWLCLVALHFVLPHNLQSLLEILAQQQAKLGQGLNRDCEQRPTIGTSPCRRHCQGPRSHVLDDLKHSISDLLLQVLTLAFSLHPSSQLCKALLCKPAGATCMLS